jgi:precorrin-4 methylase
LRLHENDGCARCFLGVILLVILSKSPLTENYGSILEIARKAVETGEKVAILHIQDACVATTIDEYCDKLSESEIDL